MIFKKVMISGSLNSCQREKTCNKLIMLREVMINNYVDDLFNQFKAFFANKTIKFLGLLLNLFILMLH